MRKQQSRSKIRELAAVLLLAMARAHAQETPRIVVSLKECKLALLDDAGRVVKTYSTAVGAPVSPSPAGTFRVVTRLANPTYYHPGVVIGPGKANPLGTRWLGLSVKGFGIHGTNRPRSIGRAAPPGCIRMRNREVEDLFQYVKVGDVVEIRGELLAEILGEEVEPATE